MDHFDVNSLITEATSSERHRLRVALTGGDSQALTAVREALWQLGAQKQPNISQMVRLSLYQEILYNNMPDLPPALPLVWAKLGDLERAEALANTGTSAAGRCARLSQIAVILAARGDVVEAKRFAKLADRVCSSFGNVQDLANGLSTVARAWFAVGEVNTAKALTARAQTLAVQQTNPVYVTWSLTGIAVTWAILGDGARATALAGSMSRPKERARAFAEVAEQLAEAEHYPQARELIEQAAHIIGGLSTFLGNELEVAAAVRAMVAAQETEAAANLAENLVTKARSSQGLTIIARRLATARNGAPTEEQGDKATELVERAIDLLRPGQANPGLAPRAATDVVVTLAHLGRFQRAREFVEAQGGEAGRVVLLADLADALAEVGELAQARDCALEAQRRAVAEVRDTGRTGTVAALAKALVGVADPVLVRRLCRAAIQMARSVEFDNSRGCCLATVSETLARVSDVPGALEAIRQIPTIDQQIGALGMAAVHLADAGRLDQAREVIQRAQTLVASLERKTGFWELNRAELLVGDQDPAGYPRTARVWASLHCGQLGQALRIAESLPDPHTRCFQLHLVAVAMIEAGDLVAARNVATQIEYAAQEQNLGEEAGEDEENAWSQSCYYAVKVLARCGDLTAARSALDAISGTLWYEYAAPEVAGPWPLPGRLIRRWTWRRRSRAASDGKRGLRSPLVWSGQDSGSVHDRPLSARLPDRGAGQGSVIG